jgi:uncharacterized protein (TIGR03437 family)
MLKGIFFGFLLSNSLLTAQGLVGSGYTAPAPVSVAQGQIATFFVAGLPSLTGITATLQQNGSIPVPVQLVSAVSLCPDATATPVAGCGSLTAVTVQIPYELGTPCPLCERPISAALATLLISQNGQAIGAIELNPVGDEVHVLTACDIALGRSANPPPPSLNGLPCTPLVTHPDGTLVSASSPANVGEALTVWAFGLGQTTPPAATGQPAKMAPAAETFNLDFNYQVNALASKPFTGEPDRIPLHPLFAGLAPGYVGLYQVNFVVPPQPPNGTPRCALSGTFAAGSNVSQSNFTVSIGGQFSFDGAGICVATQIPVD